MHLYDWQLSDHENGTVFNAVRRGLPLMPREKILQAFEKRDVRLNGQRCRRDDRAEAGGRIAVYTDYAPNVKILYEDDNLLVINKPCNLCVEDPRCGMTVMSLFRPGREGLSLCHRLDTRTAGVLLLSKNEEAEKCSLEAFKAHLPEKYYECLVRGSLMPREAVLSAYLVKDASRARVRIVTHQGAGAQKIMTGYQVLDESDAVSRLRIRLYTGRTHQIRAHMAFIGHPVIGDDLYGDRRLNRQLPLLLPATAGLIVAVCGVAFPAASKGIADFVLYLLLVSTAFGGTWLCRQVTERRSTVLDWLACGIGVFALAQIVPVPYVGLGYAAAAALTVGAPFPVAALGGLALDLARITQVPMTAVMILAFLVRFLPRTPVWLRSVAPASVYIAIAWLGGFGELLPLPGLLLGGILGRFLPPPGKATYRRGETGVAQVRLEVAAGVLSQTRQLLLEVPPLPVDEAALVDRATSRACGSCPYRKNCKDTRRMNQMPETVLQYIYTLLQSMFKTVISLTVTVQITEEPYYWIFMLNITS